jgi:hypothetical protein
MHGFLPIFFLLVVLKIPVFGSLWLVWWASREPEPDGNAAEDSDDGFGRRPPFRPRPRGPHPAAPDGLRRGRVAHSGELVSPRGRVTQSGHPSRSHTA